MVVDRPRSQRVIAAEAIDARLDALVPQIEGALAGVERPLLLCVLNGAVWFATDVLRRWQGPVEFGHVHATRYRGATAGGALEWRVPPPADLAGRTVLVVDDILDRGDTLAAVRAACMARGARRVVTAVLVRKLGIPRTIDCDFAAFDCPDLYLFGRGLDYMELWRNLPDVWAIDPDPATSGGTAT